MFDWVLNVPLSRVFPTGGKPCFSSQKLVHSSPTRQPPLVQQTPPPNFHPPHQTSIPLRQIAIFMLSPNTNFFFSRSHCYYIIFLSSYLIQAHVIQILILINIQGIFFFFSFFFQSFLVRFPPLTKLAPAKFQFSPPPWLRKIPVPLDAIGKTCCLG